MELSCMFIKKMNYRRRSEIYTKWTQSFLQEFVSTTSSLKYRRSKRQMRTVGDMYTCMGKLQELTDSTVFDKSELKPVFQAESHLQREWIMMIRFWPGLFAEL